MITQIYTHEISDLKPLVVIKMDIFLTETYA